MKKIINYLDDRPGIFDTEPKMKSGGKTTLTLKELKGLLKLAKLEIKQWQEFEEIVKYKINRLEVKHANKKETK